MSISFGGRQITRPGAYSIVDTSNMTVSAAGSFRVLGFVGPAPNRRADLSTNQVLVYNANTISQAQEDLGDGELFRLMQIAWQHGADLIYVSVVVPSVPDGEPIDSEWQEAIDRFNNEFVDGIVTTSTEGAIHAKIDTHVTTQSNVINRKERRAFLGHGENATKEEILQLASSIKSERCLLASPAPYNLTSDGNKQVLPSTALAAAIAGLWASKDPQDPITYDYVRFAGLHVLYDNETIGELIEGGVTPAEVVRGRGVRIVQAVTTYGGNEIDKKELSVSTIKDVVSQDMREFLEEKHVGNAGVAGIEVTIYNDVISRLEQYVALGYISGYVQDSVKVVKEGTGFYIDWEGEPTLPINNFFIRTHFRLQ